MRSLNISMQQSQQCISQGVPVISIDCKKKENIGNFKNGGAEYRRKGDARKVLDHDFPIKELGTVVPYGIYDVDKNTGFVNLGISHDTAEFAVNSIYQWWLHIGRETYPDAKRIYINCDEGEAAMVHAFTYGKFSLQNLLKKQD